MGRAEDLFEKIKEKGEEAIDELIFLKKSEELFLDFKRSADNGAGRVLHSSDRTNLAKAISGFGNSEGGVLVWGISTGQEVHEPADLPQSKAPVQDVYRFRSLIEGAISGCTIPPHTEIQNHAIAVNPENKGFVATLIPKSLYAPHQAVGLTQYYMRSGSSFSPVPHSVLAGMFGRRPQPKIFHMLATYPVSIQGDNSVDATLDFLFTNQGPGIAKDLFFTMKVSKVPCAISPSVRIPDMDIWETRAAMGVFYSAVSKDGVKLAPEFFFRALGIALKLKPPFINGLKLEIIYGCDNAPVQKIIISNSKETIEEEYEELIQLYKQGKATESEKKESAKIFFNLPDR